jgi:hypothetical protein
MPVPLFFALIAAPTITAPELSVIVQVMLAVAACPFSRSKLKPASRNIPNAAIILDPDKRVAPIFALPQKNVIDPTQSRRRLSRFQRSSAIIFAFKCRRDIARLILGIIPIDMHAIALCGQRLVSPINPFDLLTANTTNAELPVASRQQFLIEMLQYGSYSHIVRCKYPFRKSERFLPDQ